MVDKLLFRPEEAAEYLGMKKSKLNELAAAGYIKRSTLPPTKHSGKKPVTRYHRDDLDEFAEKCREAANDELAKLRSACK